MPKEHMLGSVLAHDFATPKAPRAFRDLLVARFREDQNILPPTPAIVGNTSTYFRASALGKVCGRAVALQIANKKRIQGDLGPQTLHMFAKGHAYHYMHQERVLPIIARDGVMGWWRSDEAILRGNHDDGRPKLWTMSQAAEALKCEAWPFANMWSV